MTYKTKKAIEWTIFSILSIVFLLSASLFFYQKAYAGKIYSNVSVAGIDLSNKTKKQAYYIVENSLTSVLQKNVTFIANESELNMPVADTGLAFNIEETVENAYMVGRKDNFLMQLYLSAKTVVVKSNLDVSASIDEEGFNKLIAEKIPGLNMEPKNAEITIESGSVTVSTEQSGQAVDTGNIKDELIKIGKEKDEAEDLTITLIATPAEPEVLSANLTGSMAVAESYLAKTITLTYEGKSYSPTKAEIGLWLTFTINSSNAYDVDLSDSAIKVYLTKIAKNFEIQKKDRKINASNNAVLEEGVEGKYLDKNAALSQIKSQIGKSNTATVALATYTEAPSEVKVYPAEGIIPGKFEGKYIDIDLAQQQLCMIEGNNILGCHIISSGKASMPTPVGIRHIDGKTFKAWSSKYGLYMPYWQSIGGGYGIHELPEWPGGFKEGENHLGIPVSHGCVRLGVGPAETLYNWTNIGTPVYIHK